MKRSEIEAWLVLTYCEDCDVNRSEFRDPGQEVKFVFTAKQRGEEE